MTEPAFSVDELRALADAACNGALTEQGVVQLERLLYDNAEAQQFYLNHVCLDRRLRWEFARQVQEPTAPAAPPPALGFLADTFHGTVGYISSGWPLAYLAATAILGVALLMAAVVPVSQPQQIAGRVGWDKRSDAPPSQGEHAPLDNRLPAYPVTVGRITGMVDCRWERTSQGPSPKTQDPRPKTFVSLGDTFALASGLVEITYDTGAKVILQGPVTYRVESRDGGFLSFGKVTARIEGTADLKSEIRNPKSETVSKSPNLQISKFVVHTPTATVTDLGTEFGVEVDKQGGTTSHVYRGSVRLQVTYADGKAEGPVQVLHENESARVENCGNQGGGNRVIVLGPSAKPADFVREIPKRTIKTLDLVDVVAGGDGFSGRRNRGIDVRNGRVTDTEEVGSNPTMGDGKYHRVVGMPFVDGIFIPNGAAGPVQLDSAGHSSAWLPATDNRTANALWAGQCGADSAELEGIDYASPGHGHLAMDANKGVTFDLEAIRRANPGYKLVRFRAVAGNTEQVSEKGAPVYADVWVFVDGQVQFRRREITRYNGAMPIVIPINDKDRFLTLVATDGGNGYQQDHIMFGDPRLELAPAKAAAGAAQSREAAKQ